MPAARILLVYGTSYGHTERIAGHIARILELNGAHAELRCGADHDEPIDPRRYDAVIVAGSVIFGKHQRYLVDFIQSHRPWLRRVPSAFFSVSASAGASDAGTRADAVRLVERFLGQMGWKPGRVATFAGSIAYTRYSMPMRLMMRLISSFTGRPTDTSRDHDMTDWPRVEHFASEFLGYAERALDGRWVTQPATAGWP